MIHYHGTPCTPTSAAAELLNGRHGFVSFARPDQLDIALEVCQSFAVDNGAFSAWKSGKPITDWSDYYQWVAWLKRLPPFDFAVVPDVIDGTETDNDQLLAEWPHEPHHSAVVWHMHESLDRLWRLASTWPRVAIGSSGQFATVGDDRWWQRIAEAMDAICDREGRPVCKLHGLRMLNPDVFTRLPFASADSTNVARNIRIDSSWRGTYTPPTKAWRAQVLAARIEQHNGALLWSKQPIQQGFFTGGASE